MKHRTDYLLILVTFLLIGIGILMILSSSIIVASERYNDGFYFLKKHLLLVGIGIILMFIFANLKYEFIQKIIPILFFLNFILLILVFIPPFGKVAGGAKRWINFKYFSVQPAEFMKLSFILFLSESLSRHQNKIKSFKNGFLPYFIILTPICFLIVLQPDFGTTVAICFFSFITLFVAGINIYHILAISLLSIPALGILIYTSSYRWQRILTFLNPDQDVLNSGYQITQSYYAIGTGKLFGVGLGNSSQKLFYLPELHTDFIFAIIGEELGFIGCLGIIMLFLIFVFKGMKIALKSQDLFGLIFAAGFTAMIGLQAAINMGVVTGLLPTKGLPLPFISFGRSNLITNMIGVGILLNINKQQLKQCVL